MRRANPSDVTLSVDDPASPGPSKLVEELDRYLISLYPGESNHLMPLESLRQPNVTFLTARIDGQIVGCGAFVHHIGHYAELKRMFVSPEFRGFRIGRRILDELEERARAAGLRIARLETGALQTGALRLYERAGYHRRSPFGSYVDDPLSVFMEKRLGN